MSSGGTSWPPSWSDASSRSTCSPWLCPTTSTTPTAASSRPSPSCLRWRRRRGRKCRCLPLRVDRQRFGGFFPAVVLNNLETQGLTAAAGSSGTPFSGTIPLRHESPEIMPLSPVSLSSSTCVVEPSSTPIIKLCPEPVRLRLQRRAATCETLVDHHESDRLTLTSPGHHTVGGCRSPAINPASAVRRVSWRSALHSAVDRLARIIQAVTLGPLGSAVSFSRRRARRSTSDDGECVG